MADRFWVGGTGNWSDYTNHWASVSGGSPGASLPSSSSDVYFDANSFTGTGQTVTVDSSASCKKFNWTGALYSPTFAGSSAINFYGDVTLISSMTFSHSTVKYFKNTTAITLTSAGNSFLSSTYIDGVGGTVNLNGDFTSASVLYIRNGTLNTNNYNLNVATISSSYSNARGFNLGSSTVTVSNAFTFDTVTNLTFSAGTSTIKMTGATKTFAGGGLTYYNLECTGTPITVTGSNTFNQIKGTASKTIKITAGTMQTLSSIDMTGTAGNLITLSSTSSGSKYFLSDSSGTNIFSYCSIKDCYAIGGAEWIAYDGTNTNAGGNSGIQWLQFVTDWDSTDYYNAVDLNRVESNSQNIATLIGTYKATPSLTGVKTDWDNADFPYADELNRIEGNIEILGLVHTKPTGWIDTVTTWVTGSIGDGYTLANRMETDLELLYDSTVGTVEYLIPCGTLKCGSDHIRQHFTRS